MSDGDSPAVASPAGDSDGDGVNNATENAIDLSARYQSRIALITAVVALISALLGPLVSLKINSDQIKSQRATATDTIKATSTDTAETAQAAALQAESEFVRGERRDAYTDFLTAYNNGAIDIIGAAGAFTDASATRKILSTQEQKALDAVKEVTSTYYKVRIVASQSAFDEAQAAYVEFSKYSGTLLQAFGAVDAGQQLTNDEIAALRNTTPEYQQLLKLSLAFIDKGRADMSADDSSS